MNQGVDVPMPQVGMEYRLLHAAWRGTNNTTAVRGRSNSRKLCSKRFRCLTTLASQGFMFPAALLQCIRLGTNPLVILVDEMVMHLMTLHRANLRNNCLHVFSVSGDTSSHCVRKHWVRPLSHLSRISLAPQDGFCTSATVSSSPAVTFFEDGQMCTRSAARPQGL